MFASIISTKSTDSALNRCFFLTFFIFCSSLSTKKSAENSGDRPVRLHPSPAGSGRCDSRREENRSAECGKGRSESVLSGTQAIKNGVHSKREPPKSGSHLHPNIFSLPYLQPHVHSQFLQLLPRILVNHPILQNKGTYAIMKIQKRSESNVLRFLQIRRKRG